MDELTRLTPEQYFKIVREGGGTRPRIVPTQHHGLAIYFVDPTSKAECMLYLSAINEPDDVRRAIIQRREDMADEQN